MVSESGGEASRGGPHPPQGRSCRGLIYFSSSRKSNGRNPLCLGLSRPEDQVHNYIAGKSEQDATKDGKSLLDFKYACVGYSIHRDNQAATGSGSESDKHAELPLCMGIEMMAERRAPEGTTAIKQEHMNQKGHQSNEDKSAAPIMPRPPSSVRPPSTVSGFPSEEFSTKFIRSAGLVAAAVGKNLSRVGNSIKAMAGDIFHPDRSRPK